MITRMMVPMLANNTNSTREKGVLDGLVGGVVVVASWIEKIKSFFS